MFLTANLWSGLPVDPLDGAFSSSAPYVPTSGVLGASPNFGGSAAIDVIAQSDARQDVYRRSLPANSFSTSGAVASFPQVQGEYYEYACPGQNFNLGPFPLQSLCNSMTCSINDCSVTTNGDTLQEQILLTNTRETQRIRSTPSKFDTFAWTADDANSSVGNMTSFHSGRPSNGELPTGAWPITFYNPLTGNRLQDDPNGVGMYIDPNTKSPVYYVNGRPILIPGGVLRGQVISATAAMTSRVADSTGADTGTVTINLTGLTLNQNHAFVPGAMIMITGNTGANASWNGFYPLLNAVATSSTTATLTFRYGRVITATSTGGVQMQSRGTVDFSTSFFITSDRFDPSFSFGGSYIGQTELSVNPVNYVSRLLGQLLPDGTQIMPTPTNVYQTVCFRYDVCEPVVMSPFVYQDALEFNTVGLYGCTNIQFTMNIQTPSDNCAVINQPSWPSTVAPYSQPKTSINYPGSANILRSTGVTGIFDSVKLQAPSNFTSTTGAFANPRLVVQFLTPGPDIQLPLISNVPYMEFPRYTNTFTLASPQDTSPVIQSQTITLSSIPDFIAVFVKPRHRCQLQNETYYPIKNVAVTFDNFSNLCSNMTQQELYTCSVATGLDLDYHTWRGYTNGCVSSGSIHNGLVGAANTAANLMITYGQSLNSTQNSSIVANLATYYYITTAAQAIPPGTRIVINGTSATGIDGLWTVLTSGLLPVAGGSGQQLLQAFVTFTSTTATLAAANIPNGQIQGYPLQKGITSTFTPVTMQNASSCGGSSVPIQLSSDAASLNPVSPQNFNFSGLNKFRQRPLTQLTGGPLLLRMGQDIALSPGLAPGTLGNFSIQINVTLDNSNGFFNAYPAQQMTIMAVNSGYFETVRGQSAVRKTILNMADVESASVSSGVTTGQLRRLVGGARGYSLGAMGHFMNRGQTDSSSRKRAHMVGSGL